MHDVFTGGIPLLAILAGILLNRSDAATIRNEIQSEFKGVRGEIRDLRTEMQARFNVLEADMRQFYHLTGKLEARMDAMEKH